MDPMCEPSPPDAALMVLRGVHAELEAWRATHPHATFADLEAAVEPQLAKLRKQLLSDLVQQGQAVHDPDPTTATERPICPTCAVPLVGRGTAERTLHIPGDQSVRLRRHYWTCPQCGGGLFPPR